jgi:Ca2+-binding EF-hand superfamily protein
MKKLPLFFSFGLVWLLPTSFAAELNPSAKVVRYATTIIKRYDTDGDGILQREEWEKMPGTPQAIDLDGDGQITKDELIWYMTQYGQSRTIHRTMFVDLSEPYKFDSANMRIFVPVWPRAGAPPVAGTTTQESSNDALEKMIDENDKPVDEDAYQKMLEERQIPASRPYHVLPESLRGVPKWFILLDKNGDGQISMAEFLERYPRAVELFKRLDKNGDGYISPDEARAARSP